MVKKRNKFVQVLTLEIPGQPILIPRAVATSPLPPRTAGPDGGDAAWWHGDCWGSGEGRFEAAWCKEPWQEAEVWEAPWHSDDWSGSHSLAMPFGGRRGGPEAPIWYDQASQCTYYSWSFQGPTRECVLPSNRSTLRRTNKKTPFLAKTLHFLRFGISG